MDMIQTGTFPSVAAIIRRRLWLILLLFVATMAVVAFSALGSEPRYRAFVKLQVIAIEQEAVTLFSQQRNVGTTEQILATEGDFIAVLVDSRIAWQTVGQLQLPMSGGELRERLSVIREGEFLTVRFDGDTPQQAQSVVTQHVNNARRFYQVTRARPAIATGDFLETQLQEQGQALSQAKDALLKFKLQHNVDSLSAEIAAYQTLVRTTRSSRDAVLMEAERAAILAAEWTKVAEEAAEEAQTFREEATQQRARVAAAEARDEEDLEAAFAASLATQRADAREALEQTYRSNASAQTAQAAAQRTTVTQYAQILAQRESDLAAFIGLNAEYDGLSAEVQLKQNDYDFLGAKAREALLKERQALELGYLQVVEEASTPQTPVTQQTVKIGLVAAAVSLMAGIVLAFLIEFLKSLGRPPPGTRSSGGRTT